MDYIVAAANLRAYMYGIKGWSLIYDWFILGDLWIATPSTNRFSRGLCIKIKLQLSLTPRTFLQKVQLT